MEVTQDLAVLENTKYKFLLNKPLRKNAKEKSCFDLTPLIYIYISPENTKISCYYHKTKISFRAFVRSFNFRSRKLYFEGIERIHIPMIDRACLL